MFPPHTARPILEERDQMAIAYWQNDNFVIFLSPENQSLAGKVGGIKSPEIMRLCLIVNS
jgi:hypothetical protein